MQQCTQELNISVIKEITSHTELLMDIELSLRYIYIYIYKLNIYKVYIYKLNSHYMPESYFSLSLLIRF